MSTKFLYWKETHSPKRMKAVEYWRTKVTETLQKIPHRPRPPPPIWWVSFFFWLTVWLPFVLPPTTDLKNIMPFFWPGSVPGGPNWNHTHQHSMVKGRQLQWESNYLWSTFLFFSFFNLFLNLEPGEVAICNQLPSDKWKSCDFSWGAWEFPT